VDTPDPYVKLFIRTAPNGKKKTKAKKNTANPVWEEEFQFLLNPDMENDLGEHTYINEINFLMNKKYSRTPLTRTLKGNENLFELAGFRVIGVD